MSKKFISILFRVSVSIILIIFLFRQVDRKVIFGIIKSANMWLLVTSFLVFILGYIISLYRWEMLLKVVHVHLSIKRIVISFSGGLFFNLFLPSTIGGDLVRSFDLASHTKKPKEIIATVLLDRISGYAGLIIVTLLALLFGHRLIQDKTVIMIIGIITAVLILILLAIFNNFLFSKLNQLLHSPTGNRLMIAIKDTHQEMYYFRHHKKMLWDNLLYSIMIQISSPISFYLIALALGIRADALYFFIFVPLIGAITLLPISIGGLGLRDATTIYFFAKIGILKDLAFALSLTVFFFTLLIGVIGGIVYVFTLHTRRLQYYQAV